MNPDLYKMILHETYRDDTAEGHRIITRVPGGWIYTFHRLDCNIMTSVFVRYDNEFQGGH